jgi:NDP-sugar pyrophosphorylase family protein
VNAGILVVEPAALQFIPVDEPYDFGRDVIPVMVAAGQPVYGYRMAEGLWWVDTPEDLERTKRAFEDKKIFT